MSAAALPRFARVAAAIGDPTRALMLSRLLDGRFYTATDLAAHAGVSAPTASQHLKLLVDEGLARTCYGHLAGELGVALCRCFVRRGWVLAGADGAAPAFALTPPGAETLRRLGVPAGVAVAEAGTEAGAEAEAGAGAGAGAGAAGAPGRRLLYGCVDWSERRDHFAGPLAVALLDALVARDWLRRDGDSRALTATAQGRAGLAALLADAPAS